MGLREIEAACGFIRNDMAVTIKKMKLKSIARRRTTVAPRRLTTYYPRTYVDESESIDEDASFNYIEEDYVVEEERTDSEPELMSIRSTKFSRASNSRRNTDASRRSTVGKPLPIIKQSPKTSRIAVRIETEDSVGVISDSEDFSSSGSSHAFEMEKDSQIIVNASQFNQMAIYSFAFFSFFFFTAHGDTFHRRGLPDLWRYFRSG